MAQYSEGRMEAGVQIVSEFELATSSNGVSVGESNDAGTIAVEEVGREGEIGRELKRVRVVEGFRVRESVEEVEVGKRARRGRATEMVKEEGGRWHEVVRIERALYEIGV
ncbi:hypothetical protein SESBI_22828 [Sesbania bispinosa]|nr:hypothetical protein SESBI_22828 [Sesbania bispinosa]